MSAAADPGPIIQVYEIQDAQQAQLCIDLGIEHIGGVLLDADHAFEPTVRAAIKAVQGAGLKYSLIPLFSDLDLICRAVEFHQPNIVHYCEAVADEGGLSSNARALAAVQGAVRHRFPHIAQMRAVPVACPGQSHRLDSLAVARLFEEVSDYFITDTWLMDRGEHAQPVSGFVGITGQVGDWKLVRRLVASTRVPVIVAGGLDASNASAALKATGAAGIDSCTRTNEMDSNGQPVRFRKCPRRLGDFVRACRG